MTKILKLVIILSCLTISLPLTQEPEVSAADIKLMDKEYVNVSQADELLAYLHLDWGRMQIILKSNRTLSVHDTQDGSVMHHKHMSLLLDKFEENKLYRYRVYDSDARKRQDIQIFTERGYEAFEYTGSSIDQDTCLVTYTQIVDQVKTTGCQQKLHNKAVSIKHLSPRPDRYSIQVTFENLPAIQYSTQTFTCSTQGREIRKDLPCLEKSLSYSDTLSTLPTRIFNLSNKYGRISTTRNSILIESEIDHTGQIIPIETVISEILPISSSLNMPFTLSREAFDIRIPKAKLTYSTTVNRFIVPLALYPKVTQWYGNTVYASPHTGIDYTVYKQPVYAVGDGIVRSLGWDNFLGECNSGGNYINIEHAGGVRSVYMHLTNFKKADGRALRPGDKVKKGQQIGISGNTGASNCNALGYHLHHEIRTGSSFTSHTDPVPLTIVDWGRILTADPQRYPGRLTGDNPHPGR